jgi:hypothetical protein
MPLANRNLEERHMTLDANVLNELTDDQIEQVWKERKNKRHKVKHDTGPELKAGLEFLCEHGLEMKLADIFTASTHRFKLNDGTYWYGTGKWPKEMLTELEQQKLLNSALPKAEKLSATALREKIKAEWPGREGEASISPEKMSADQKAVKLARQREAARKILAKLQGLEIRGLEIRADEARHPVPGKTLEQRVQELMDGGELNKQQATKQAREENYR